MTLAEIKEALDSIDTAQISSFTSYLRGANERIAFSKARAVLVLRYGADDSKKAFHALLGEIPAEPTLANFERLKGLVEAMLDAGWK